MLIEVMFGALILGLATTAVLSGVDGAQETGRKNKNRSVAATLAQQDIERLRAFPIASISDLDQTRTVSVSGVDYTVHSTSEWVKDSTGIITCTDNTKQAQYLKLSTTVSSPASVTSPVKESTLLAPGAGTGAAVVNLTDRDGAPVSLASVRLTGPANVSGATNAEGCAIFGGIPPGSYTVEVPALVTWASQLPGTGSVNVPVGNTSVVAMEVDVPASLRAHFKTPTGAAMGPDGAWNQITVAHSNLPGKRKVFPPVGSPLGPDAVSLDAEELFPQKVGYQVYAGSCPASNPDLWNGTADYFQPGGKGFVALDPGDVLRDVDVYMPTLRVRVARQSGGNFTVAHLRLTHTSQDTISGQACNETRTLTKTSATAISNWTFDVALPFGHYRLCADTNSTGSPGTFRSVTTSSSSFPRDQNLTSEVNAVLTNTTAGQLNSQLAVPSSGTSAC